MPFKHLFIFSHSSHLQHFLRTLEERVLYSAGSRIGRASWSRLKMWNHDGEHEITLALVHDIEGDRFRGRYFDKVSIHEAVELTHHIHTFVQLCVARTSRALYESLYSEDNLKRRSISSSNNPYLPDGYIEELPRKKTEEVWTRQICGEWLS